MKEVIITINLEVSINANVVYTNSFDQSFVIVVLYNCFSKLMIFNYESGQNLFSHLNDHVLIINHLDQYLVQRPVERMFDWINRFFFAQWMSYIDKRKTRITYGVIELLFWKNCYDNFSELSVDPTVVCTSLLWSFIRNNRSQSRGWCDGYLQLYHSGHGDYQ